MRSKQDIPTYNASIYLRSKSSEREKWRGLNKKKIRFMIHAANLVRIAIDTGKVDAWMRSIRIFRVSDCQCQSRNNPGFDASILRHNGIWGAADEAVFNTVQREKIQKISLINFDVSSHHCLHRIAYCQSNCLLILLERAETEIRFLNGKQHVQRKNGHRSPLSQTNA